MGKLADEIRVLVKGYKSLDLAKQDTEKWFRKALSSASDKSVNRTSEAFKPGKIYVFRYEDTITENEWWDLHPVVLSLGRKDGKDIGINLNLIPHANKQQLLDKIYTFYKTKIDDKIEKAHGNSISESFIASFNYDAMKPFLEKTGFAAAVRTYATGNRKNSAVISYSEWRKVALLDLAQIKGASINVAYKKYRKYIKNKNT